MRRIGWVGLFVLGCGGAEEQPSGDGGNEDGGVVSLGSVGIASGAVDVAIDGTTVWALGAQELFVLDASAPTTPTTITNAQWGGNGLFYDGTSIYVSHGLGPSSMAIRVTGALDPCRTDDTCTDYSVGPRAATRLQAVGSRVYAASGNGVLGVDLETDPPLLPTIGLLGAVNDVAATGTLVAAATSEAGATVINVASFPPDAPQAVIEANGGAAMAVFFLDAGALLVGSAGGLATYSITVEDGGGGTPTPDFEELGQLDLEGSIFYAASGNAYVIGGPCPPREGAPDGGGAVAGFHVIDVSDPSRPRETACAPVPDDIPVERTFPQSGRGLAVEGGLAALAADYAVYFLSVPTTPVGEGEAEAESESESEGEGEGDFLDGGS